MLFPFRTSAIFRNRWVALLWAAGICFTASEIVDSLSSVTDKGATHAPANEAPAATPARRDNDPLAAVFEDAPARIKEKPGF